MFELPDDSFAASEAVRDLAEAWPGSPRWIWLVKMLRRVEQRHLRSQGERRCSRCAVVHPQDYYYRNGQGLIYGVCKACHKVQVARSRAERRGGKPYTPRKRAGAGMEAQYLQRIVTRTNRERTKKERALIDKGIPPVSPTTKRCSRCKGEYNVHGGSFHKNGKSKDGFARQCKACVAKLAEIRRDARGKE